MVNVKFNVNAIKSEINFRSFLSFCYQNSPGSFITKADKMVSDGTSFNNIS